MLFWKVVQSCSKLFKVVQSCSKLFKVVQGCSKLFKVVQGKVTMSQLLTSKTVESNSPTKSIEIPSTDVFSEAGDDVSTGRGAPHRAGAGV